MSYEYLSAGDYVICMSGVIHFELINNKYITHLISLNKFTSNLDNTFENCINLQSIPSTLFNYPWCKSAKKLFKNCYSIRNISKIDGDNSNYLEFVDSAFENC
jgi:hypothetical protein